jgi:hypothetical protein
VNRALRAATIGCLLIAPVALSSCSAGQIPQTSTQNRDKVGALATIGAIDLREVKLPFPTGGTYAQGGDAELVGAVVNGGTEADTLVSVTGDDFTGIRISGSGTAPQSTTSSLSSVPGGPVGTIGTGGASSSSSSSSSSSGSSSSSQANQTGPTTAATGIAGATGTPSAAAPSAEPSASSLAVPADTTLFFGQNSPHVFLTGLKRTLTAGQVVRVTFTFQRAGSVTLDAFVSSPVSYVPNSSSFDFEQPSEANVPGNEAGGGGVGGSSGGNG